MACDARARARAGEEESMKAQRSGIDPHVFLVAAVVSVAFVLVGALWTDELATIVGDVLGWIVDNFGWFFVLSTVGILVVVAFLALSRFGTIRLGRDDDRPEFR